MSTTTSQAEYGLIKSLTLKCAEDAFISPDKVDAEWKDLAFTEALDWHESVREYAVFMAILEDRHRQIHYLVEDASQSLDSIYCRDAAIMTDSGLILCNMGKENRRREPSAYRQLADRLQIPILGEIHSPGTVEGGDVAWIDGHTLAVGHSYRTNQEGIRQLAKFLNPLGISIVEVDLPHYRGSNDVFHLMSIFSPVARDIAVVYSPLMPIRFRNYLLEHSFQLVEVPDVEFDTLGCNVLAFDHGHCLMVEGNPITQKSLENLGVKVITFKGQEICMKGGGGPTCLTRPLFREI
ncbi:MAG: hypothetical protein KDC53_23495 [Saprospiraceae bacterium]|nr:hypothetical protein [Saprospiraceae bacterium]